MQILGGHAIKLPGGHAVQTWKSPEMTVFECCEMLMNVFQICIALKGVCQSAL